MFKRKRKSGRGRIGEAVLMMLAAAILALMPGSASSKSPDSNKADSAAKADAGAAKETKAVGGVLGLFNRTAKDKKADPAVSETPAPAPVPAAEDPAPTPAAVSPSDWSWDGPGASKSDAAAPAAEAPSPPASTPVVKISPDPAPSGVGGTARNLVGIDVKKDQDMARVVLKTDGAVGDYSAFTLDKPVRLVVDIWGLKNPAKIKDKDVNDQGVLKVRAGEHGDKLRLVFDVNPAVPHYRFDKGADGLTITFSEKVDVSAAPEISVAAAGSGAASGPADGAVVDPSVSAPPASPAKEVAQANYTWDSSTTKDWSSPTPPTSAPAPSGGAPSTTLDWGPVNPPSAPSGAMMSEKEMGIGYVDAVKFEYSAEASTIILHADRPFRRELWTREDNEKEQVVSLFFSKDQVAADQQRSYDTKEFNGPVELFSVFQRPTKTNEVAVVIVLREPAASKWQQFDNKFVISFENYPGSLGVGGADKTGTFGLTGQGPETTTKGPSYSGKTISLDFKNMDILDALRTVAEASGMNMVVADEVKGNITIKLENVPWDQALDIILQTKGLDKVETGNILRIAKKATIAKEKQDDYNAKINAEGVLPLTVAVIPINYLNAQDLVKVVKPNLSKRGTVDADKRTNSVFIRDLPDTIADVRKLIAQLDQPTRQVLIEARIVEASQDTTRELGVQWGANLNIGPGTGTPTGLDFPNTVQVGGATLGGSSSAALGAGSNSGGGGALGITVGHLTNVLNLDVMLRALEAQSKIKIISSPRVLTLTDQRAMIQQGVSIPYPPPATQGVGAGGASSGWLFAEASLMLEVTPRVSKSDNTVVMEVKVQNNQPITVPGASAPGISKKEAQTTILLHDGETAVLGGIFKITNTRTATQPPYLGNLPVVGALFRDVITSDANTELIIFLTPQIIQPGSAVSEAMSGMAITK
jgi:type IV pilus assembly protein PilQ